jgi:hypothetical protein
MDLHAIRPDADSMLPLLNSLAGTNAAEIAVLVPQLVGLPDDPRLVEPLWRCLTAPGIEGLPECRQIVQHLLTLVEDPNALAELERQDRYGRDFLTSEIRWRAYPFNRGLEPSHNLVTLLAWAEYVGVAPAGPNRFFQAKAASRLDRVERDRRRTVSFSLFRPARLLSGALLLAALTAAVVVVVTEPQRLLLHPFGWWTVLFFLGVGESPFWLYAIIFSMFPNFLLDYFEPSVAEKDQSRNSGNMVIGGPDWYWIIGTFVAVPFAFTISSAPLLADSLPGYILLSLGSQVVFWATDIKLCTRGRRNYFYRPNEFVDMYDDPRSRHWLGVAGPGLELGAEGAGSGGSA